MPMEGMIVLDVVQEHRWCRVRRSGQDLVEHRANISSPEATTGMSPRRNLQILARHEKAQLFSYSRYRWKRNSR